MGNNFKTEMLDGLQYAIDRSKNLNNFAQTINISQQNIFNWVNGKSAPTLDKISAVMDSLGAHVVFPWTKTANNESDFSSQVLELKEKIKELNEQIANYKVITEGYQQLFKVKK